MSNEPAVRRAAASQIAKMIVDPAGRDLLNRQGWKSGAPIVVVLESDTIGTMFKRVVEADAVPPAIIAVPSRDSIVVLTLSPSPLASAVDQHQIGENSTVGMLISYLETQQNGSLVFTLTWGVATVSHSEPVGC